MIELMGTAALVVSLISLVLTLLAMAILLFGNNRTLAYRLRLASGYSGILGIVVWLAYCSMLFERRPWAFVSAWACGLLVIVLCARQNNRLQKERPND